MESSQPAWHKVSGNAAERYERELVPAMFAPWAPILVAHTEIRPGDRVLDIACGTGVAARAAAERTGFEGRVIGLDINPAMLAVARSTQPDRDRIEWVEASALDMPFPDHAFTVVLCQQGLQQIPDRQAALHEMHRVLEPGGRLAIAVWSHLEGSPGMAALVAALERHVSAAAARNRRAPFALGDAAQLVDLVATAGFHGTRLATLVESARFPSPDAFITAQLAATPLSTLGKMSEETRDAVSRDVRTALHKFVQDGDELVVPMEAHIVVARAAE